jgi:hypothetical protein
LKFGLVISTLLHASIVLFVAYGMPRFVDRLEIIEEPLVVELVTIAEETTPQPAEQKPLQPPDAEVPAPPKVAMTPPPAPPKLEAPPPPRPKPKTAEPPPPPAPAMPKMEKRPPPPPPTPKLAMATPPAKQRLPPPPPAPMPVPKPVAATPPPPLPKVPKPPPPKPPKKALAKVVKSPRPKAKPKPPKKDFTSTLDRISALLDKSEKPRPAPTAAAKTATAPPRSEVSGRAAANVSESRELTIREIDALRLIVKKQIELCWSVPGGARDAENLVVTVRFFLNRDGSLASQPEIADGGRMRVAGGEFYRTAAESARRAVLQCSPLTGLPLDKYEHWREVTLRFNPKDMLQ